MLISSTIILGVVASVIWLATRAIISKARENAQKREELSRQLLHASKLASLGELATGVAHEINIPLAIIIATTGVIRDMFNPEFNLEWTPQQICEELTTIETAVFRARGITRQLLDYGHKNQPCLVSTDIHAMLEDILSGFKEHALALVLLNVLGILRWKDINAIVFSVARNPETGQQLVTMKDFFVHGSVVFLLSLAVLWVWVFLGYWRWF